MTGRQLCNLDIFLSNMNNTTTFKHPFYFLAGLYVALDSMTEAIITLFSLNSLNNKALLAGGDIAYFVVILTIFLSLYLVIDLIVSSIEKKTNYSRSKTSEKFRRVRHVVYILLAFTLLFTAMTMVLFYESTGLLFTRYLLTGGFATYLAFGDIFRQYEEGVLC